MTRIKLLRHLQSDVTKKDILVLIPANLSFVINVYLSQLFFFQVFLCFVIFSHFNYQNESISASDCNIVFCQQLKQLSTTFFC